MAADRPYGEFYDFYSVSPEYFGCTLISTHQIKAQGKLLLGVRSFGTKVIKHDDFYEQNAMSHSTSAIKR
jgi:hypothetical protein